MLLTLVFRAPPSPNTLTAYKAAAAKTNVSTAPPHIAGGVFIALNRTSSTGNSTGSSTGTSTGSSTGSYTGNSTGASPYGGGSLTGAGTSTSTSTSTSSVISFTGAAGRISSGVMAVVLGAAGVAGLAFL